MNISRRLVFIAFCFGLGRSEVFAADVFPCEGTSARIHCLLERYDVLRQRPDWLEKAYLAAEAQATVCSSPKDTSEFLEFVVHIEGKAALEEYFSEAIEKKIIEKHPECFLKALSLASAAAQIKICSMLRNPTFLERKKINMSFGKLKSTALYSQLIDKCLNQ